MDNGKLTYEIVEKAIDELKTKSKKPLANGSVIIEFNVLTHLIDVINHQKAEIEFLKQDNMTPMVTKIGDYLARIEKAKAEAYKEFAERLKEKATTEFWHGTEIRELSNPFVTIKKIDNLVKEMVGDNE